jgi:hypothetical protein
MSCYGEPPPWGAIATRISTRSRANRCASTDGHLIKMRTPLRMALQEGEAVRVGFEESALHLFERESGLRREPF